MLSDLVAYLTEPTFIEVYILNRFDKEQEIALSIPAVSFSPLTDWVVRWGGGGEKGGT